MPIKEYKIYFDGRYHTTTYSGYWNNVKFYKRVAELGGFKFEVEEISLD